MVGLKKSKQKTYRDKKLDDSRGHILVNWQDKKLREEAIEFCLEGVSRKKFEKTFMGILERDRLEAERTGRDWPEDYR